MVLLWLIYFNSPGCVSHEITVVEMFVEWVEIKLVSHWHLKKINSHLLVGVWSSCNSYQVTSCPMVSVISLPFHREWHCWFIASFSFFISSELHAMLLIFLPTFYVSFLIFLYILLWILICVLSFDLYSRQAIWFS